MTSVGVWTDGIDQSTIMGPWLALNRILLNIPNENHNIDMVYIHCRDVDREIYRDGSELLVNKNVVGKLKIAGAEFDAIFVNGVPTTLPSAIFHTYPSKTLIGWAHGSLPWTPKYAYGDSLNPNGFRNQLYNYFTKLVMRRAASRFDILFAASKFKKRVLVEGFDVPSNRIEVINFGVDHKVFHPYDIRKENDILTSFGIHQPFLLFVGVNTPRKSPHTVIRAFDHINKKGYNHDLVIVGKGYEDSSLKCLVENRNLEEDVIFTGFIEESDVAKLYSASDAFVFPTLHENFGMPILEAMAAGTPVISTNHAAVPEVAGDAAVLIDDPTDPKVVADAVIRVVSERSFHKELVKKGFSRSKQFTWAKTANQFIKTLEEYLL